MNIPAGNVLSRTTYLEDCPQIEINSIFLSQGPKNLFVFGIRYVNPLIQLPMHIVIIGNGIAGITTARHVRKLSDHTLTVISGETEHFFSRTALMYIYMGHMRYKDTKPYEDFFWKKNRIDLVFDQVNAIVPDRKVLKMASGKEISYDKLVLATGSRPNTFGWPGENLTGVQGMVSKQDLDQLEALTPTIRHAVVAGGGLIGIELAEMLHSRGIPVTFLVREKSFWKNVLPPEESAMVNAEILLHGIDLRLGEEIASITGDADGRVQAVVTKSGTTIDCQFVGITAGVSPNLDLAQSAGVETRRGFLVNELLETSVPGIYAIGDCAELREVLPGRKNVEAVWYTGKLMGPVLAKTLCGTPTAYQQTTWFNSAKFFEIEYQIYGEIAPEPSEGVAHLAWFHLNGKHAIRIAYRKQNGQVLGFHLMGVRYRQAVCTHWIEQGTHIEEVLQNLGAANFDPEFFTQYEQAVLDAYAEASGVTLTLRRRRGWKQVLATLSLK